MSATWLAHKKVEIIQYQASKTLGDSLTNKIFLSANEALGLWQQGVKAWNARMQKYINKGVHVEIDLSGVVFSKNISNELPIDFSGFHFPNGETKFIRSEFAGNRVKFDGAIFFGGKVSFLLADFGHHSVSFKNADFRNTHVDFSLIKFSGGMFDFSSANLGERDVFFGGANIKCDFFVFENSCASGARIIFDESSIKGGVINFSKCDFENSRLTFDKAAISSGSKMFESSKFGDTSFDQTDMGGGVVSFKHSSWKGGCIFSPASADKLIKIDFSSVSIDGELSFGDFETQCVIDLRHTKLARPIDLDRANIKFTSTKADRKWWRFNYEIAKDKEDSTRYRRLKKLAKDADDLDRQLEFFANEMRSSYGHSIKGSKLGLFLLYDKMSDYGRSVSRPSCSLLVTLIMFGLVYFDASYFYLATSSKIPDNMFSHFITALTFSLSQTIPLYNSSRLAQSETMLALFGSGDVPDLIHWVTIFQGIVAGAFIFLVALALRNNFRS